MFPATLLAHPDGCAFSQVEIELSDPEAASVEIRDLIRRIVPLCAESPLFLRRLRPGTAADADTAVPAAKQYRYAAVSDAAAAKHIVGFTSILEDPDNPSVDEYGNPAVWLKQPQQQQQQWPAGAAAPVNSNRTPAAAAGVAAATSAAIDGTGLTQSATDSQQQSAPGGKQSRGKAGSDSSSSSSSSGPRDLMWQAKVRDMAAIGLVRFPDKKTEKVQTVSVTTEFPLSPADGELSDAVSGADYHHLH
jgi:hypothetical protein